MGLTQSARQRAAAAGLPGTYKAWLSDNTGSPSTRFVQSTAPYRRIDGVTVAANFTDLTDNNLTAPIGVTESGGAVGDPVETWTSTNPDGARTTSGGNCDSWNNDTAIFTGNVGSATSSNGSWSNASDTTFCDQPRHLYCFQQG